MTTLVLAAALLVPATVVPANAAHVYAHQAEAAASGPGSENRSVDTIPPTVTLTGPTSPATITATATVSWSGADNPGGSGISHYVARYRVSDGFSPFGEWLRPTGWERLLSSSVTIDLTPGLDYCFEVAAVDKAGNSSGYTSQKCTDAPEDDRSLDASAGWTTSTNAGYYKGTATTSTQAGATLTWGAVPCRSYRDCPHFDHVGVVATTCPRCGVIGIYAGTTLLGTLDLASSSLHRKVMLWTPRITATAVAIVVEILSSGKRVEIDGLAASPT